MIREYLKDKRIKDQARIKSRELAKVKLPASFVMDDITVKITGEIEAVEVNGNHGIQVFAQAWKNGKQLGFGKDGKTDIERFRFINPRILVDDERGDIEIRNKKNIVVRKLKENHEEAIKQCLVGTIIDAGIENTEIKIGSIGNTTTTFYSGAGDGFYGKWQMDNTWAECISGAYGVVINDTNDAQQVAVRTNANITTDHYTRLYRGGLPFDTSALTGQQVDSGTLSIYGVSVESGFSPSYSIYTGTGLSFTGLGGTESASATDIAYGSFSTVAYNNYTLNTAGEAHVNVAGTSVFGLRSTFDGDASAPTWSSGVNSELIIYYSEETGTTKDPKLVIVHSDAPVGPTNLKTVNETVKASVKTMNETAIASIKTTNEVT
jgi:hypothetical protein